MNNKTSSIFIKKLLLFTLIPFVIFILASCGIKEYVDTLDRDKTFIKIGSETVTQGELYDELKWDGIEIIEEKQKQLFLHNLIDEIRKSVLNDGEEKHNEYLKKVQRAYIREVLNINEKDSLGEDIKIDPNKDDYEWRRYKLMNENEVNLHINEYYDKYFFKGLKLERDEIKRIFKNLTYNKQTALFNLDTKTLEEEYENIYINVAEKIYNYDEKRKWLDKEVSNKKEYFDKKKVVDNYYNTQVIQGEFSAFLVSHKGYTKEEILKKFGLKEEDKYLYLIRANGRTPQEYESYINSIDSQSIKNNDDSVNLDIVLSKSFVLQFYIGIYNYLNPYKETIPNLDFKNVAGEKFEYEKDAVEFTENLYKFYYNLARNGGFTKEADESRVEQIFKNIPDGLIKLKYTREEINEKGERLYIPLFKEYKKDKDVRNKNIESDNEHFYFLLDYKGTKEDEDVNVDMREDDQFEIIKNNGDLFNKVIDSLKDKEMKDKFSDSDEITGKLKDVKVKIYDKDIEIAYHKKNPNYSKTLGSPRTNNMVALLEYDNNSYEIELFNGKDGYYDKLEKESGFDKAIEIIAKRKIKKLDLYKNIDDKEIKKFRERVERDLQLFIAGQTEVDAKIGKYNYLMSKYHTAEIDKIIDNYYKIEYVINRLIKNFANDEIVNLYLNYATKQSEKNFPKAFKSIQVMLDKDDDGIPDPIVDEVQFKQDATELLLIAQDYLLNIKPKDIESKNFKEYYEKSRIYKYSKEDTMNKLSEFKLKGYKILETPLSLFEKVEEDKGPEDNYVATDNYDVVFKKYASLLLEDRSILEEFRKSGAYHPKIKKTGEIFDISKQSLLNTSNTIYTGNKLTYMYYSGGSEFKDERLNLTYTKEQDQDGIYENRLYFFNDEEVIIDNLYSQNEITLNQTKAFLFDKVQASSSSSLPKELQESTQAILSEVYSRFSSKYVANEIYLVFILMKDISKTDIDEQGVKDTNIEFGRDDLATHYRRYKNYLLRNEIFKSNDDYILTSDITPYKTLIKTTAEFYYDFLNKEVK